MSVGFVTLGKVVYQDYITGEGPEVISSGGLNPEIVSVTDEPATVELKPEIIRAEEQ